MFIKEVNLFSKVTKLFGVRHAIGDEINIELGRYIPKTSYPFISHILLGTNEVGNKKGDELRMAQA